MKVSLDYNYWLNEKKFIIHTKKGFEFHYFDGDRTGILLFTNFTKALKYRAKVKCGFLVVTINHFCKILKKKNFLDLYDGLLIDKNSKDIFIEFKKEAIL